MSRRTWQRPIATNRGNRDATRAAVVEAIDRIAPETKAALATQVDISEQYLSELLSELKADDVVRKGYVVDDAALYENAHNVSRLYGDLTTRHSAALDDATPVAEEPARTGDIADRTGGSAATVSGNSQSTGACPDPADRGTAVLDLLERLESVTTRQYEAAEATFLGESVEHPADTLESLTNERWSAVLSELKSYTLTTDWPGNRIAADLSTIATDLEIVGDRACFIADVVDRENTDASGIVAERMADIFAAGRTINDLFCTILFDCELEAHGRLQAVEETVHRDLDELFELVTAYDPDVYGYLVTITRALERAIYYWVDAAEIAIQIHSGVTPTHIEL